jgi:6-phosphogluconate dehydrogenase (decarboxylating)
VNVGFIGLGDMGQAIVPRLLEAGRTRRVAALAHQRTPGWISDDRRAAAIWIECLSSWLKRPAAEPEITVYMGKDLPESADRKTTIEAIADLGAAMNSLAGLRARVFRNGEQLGKPFRF